MRRTVGALLAVLLALAACSPDQPERQTEPPGSTVVETPAADSPLAGCPATGTVDAAANTIGSITLPCFTGGEAVNLGGLGRPALVNLWASWCAPCRTELPDLQKLADRAGDDLLVLGVVTGDTLDRAASLAEDLQITFPAVFDPDAEVQRTAGRRVLPLTLFLDADGGVRYVHATSVLTEQSAADLVRTHLGVEVR